METKDLANNEEWRQQYMSYLSKVEDGSYMLQQFYDDRNSDSTKDRIEADKISRETTAYLAAISIMIGDFREDLGMKKI